MAQHILLTGGAGFIGSHTYVALAEAGYQVTILDNFHNAQRDVPDRLSQITGAAVPVLECDICDAGALNDAFAQHDFDAVVHFAARKSVPEGEADPLGYYQTNCTGLLNVAAAMQAHGVNRIVFSSSAAIYGTPEQVPTPETCPAQPGNTYAQTKLFGENLLFALERAHPGFTAGVLRYFNPVGAHGSGLIGEDPSQLPTNLVPVIARVALGQMDKLKIFGSDYPTRDGTGVRDYIHVEDLARGHVLSLKALLGDRGGHCVNLGTGTGHTVQEVRRAYEAASGQEIPYELVPARAGDAAMSYAATEKARQVLGFETAYGLAEMCESNWTYAKGALR